MILRNLDFRAVLLFFLGLNRSGLWRLRCDKEFGQFRGKMKLTFQVSGVSSTLSTSCIPTTRSKSAIDVMTCGSNLTTTIDPLVRRFVSVQPHSCLSD